MLLTAAEDSRRPPGPPRSGQPAPRSASRRVRHAAPARLGGELDGLAVAVGLDVGEGERVGVVGDVELTLLDALVEPGAAEDQSPQPVDEGAVGGADELGPAVVDVLAEGGGRVLDLAVDGEVDQILQLLLLEAAADEAQFEGRLLAALGEVALVEGEAELAVLENEVLARVVVAASLGVMVHRRAPVRSGGRRHHRPYSCTAGTLARTFA